MNALTIARDETFLGVLDDFCRWMDTSSKVCNLEFAQMENDPMNENEYEVTYANGEVVVITAWTPEAAVAIADEDGDLYGCPGISAVSASLLDSQPVSL